MPCVDQALSQIDYISNWRLMIHMIWHHAPYSTVSRTKIRTSWMPEVCRNEFRSFPLKELDCLTFPKCWCTGAKYYRNRSTFVETTIIWKGGVAFLNHGRCFVFCFSFKRWSEVNLLWVFWFSACLSDALHSVWVRFNLYSC